MNTTNTKPNKIRFEDCLTFLEKAGRAYFHPDFNIHQSDHNIIFKLLIYFYQDHINAEKLNIDFRKGILLTGPIGCGKTTLMTLMRFFLAPKYQHIMKSTRDINLEFIHEGHLVINKYSNGSFHTKGGEVLPKTYCFDDLGIDSSIKYYGNDTNVMGEILLNRYDLFVNNNMLTHATTNLNADELENLYGNRVRSRMREMFNLISFKNNTPDKRK